MENNTLFRRAALLVLALGGLFAVWLAMKYALPIALPILVAWGLGSCILPLSEGLSRRTKIPNSLCSIVLILLFVSLFALILVFSANRLMTELLRLAESIGEGAKVGDIGEYLNELTSRLPIIRDIRLNEFWQGIDTAARDAIFGGLKAILTGIGDAVMRLLTSLPTTILTLTVTLIATYYFSTQKSRDALTELLPDGVVSWLSALGEKTKPVLRGWAKAYLLLMALTFVELFIGFSLMGVNYAFLAAAAVALVDILPLLGTGTVLIPWAVIGFITGDRSIGIGMLILYAVIGIIRQFAEPKLVGKSLGIPPLVSLIAMYVGFRLFGFFGLITAPAVVMLALTVKEKK